LVLYGSCDLLSTTHANQRGVATGTAPTVDPAERIPVILAPPPVLEAVLADPAAKFPVNSAYKIVANALILRMKLALFVVFQARERRKYPVIETRSRQTASTAND
jgi:hypothetical protein